MKNLNKPVVFAYGNGGEPAHWSKYWNYFIENGYSKDDAWLVSFSDIKTHTGRAEKLNTYIEDVLEKSNGNEVSIVAHSLGVTVVRYWMEKYDRHDCVSEFVGIAGANHGIVNSPPREFASMLPKTHTFKPCQYLSRAGFSGNYVSELNKQNETPGDIEYYTIRGSKDSFFFNCKYSPKLEGAKNVELDETHMGLLSSEEAIKSTYEWVTA
jgi:triacylglycerol esterase/lipase EstA (alpha/beta hydrolase family)